LGHATNAGRAAIEPAIQTLGKDGRWGAVFNVDTAADMPALVLLAVGERHPAKPWQRSVYEIAHRRLHR